MSRSPDNAHTSGRHISLCREVHKFVESSGVIPQTLCTLFLRHCLSPWPTGQRGLSASARPALGLQNVPWPETSTMGARDQSQVPMFSPSHKCLGIKSVTQTLHFLLIVTERLHLLRITAKKQVLYKDFQHQTKPSSACKPVIMFVPIVTIAATLFLSG